MTFEARYRGQCADCGEPVNPGDLVDYDDNDDLIHATCPDDGDVVDDDAPRRNERRCDDCFTTHAGGCL